MAIFRRSGQKLTDPRPAIAEFWAWWSANRDEVIKAADADDHARVAELLEPAVTALHPELSWELTRATNARFTLVVSGGPHLSLRALAERWYDAAPPADADVEYAPQKPPNPAFFTSTVVVDDYELPMAELVAGTRMDPEQGRLDVAVHHPLFTLLDEPDRLDLAFGALQAALGEDGVERWLGAVEVSVDAPIDSFAVSALAAVVDQLQGASEQVTWATLTGKSRFGTVEAMVRRPLARVDFPLCDTYLGLVVPYPADRDGLPSHDSVTTAIFDVGHHIVAAVADDDRHAVHVGHELLAKRAYVHCYVDGLEVDLDSVRQLVADWPFGKAKLVTRSDPAWRRVSRLLG